MGLEKNHIIDTGILVYHKTEISLVLNIISENRHRNTEILREANQAIYGMQELKETLDKIYLVYTQLFTLDVKPGIYYFISTLFFSFLGYVVYIII